jgi:hypothetical protein
MVRITVVAQVESHDLEATLEQHFRQRKHVQRRSAAFPAMQQDHNTSGAVRRARVETLQPDPVTAVEEKVLLGRDHRPRPTHDRAPAGIGARQHGLHVSVPEPPGRLEIVAVYVHGHDAPERSPHPNLHAVVGAGGTVPFTGREIG